MTTQRGPLPHGLVRIVIAALVIVFAVAFFTQTSTASFVEETRMAINRIGLPTLMAVLALSLVNYLARFARWAIYIGEPPQRLSLLRHLGIYLAGFALTATPTKAGEAVRSAYLRPLGVSYQRSIAALLGERLFDIAVISALAALILWQDSSPVRWIGLVGLGLVTLIVLLQHPAVLAVIERLTRRLPAERLRRFGAQMLSLQHEVRGLMRPSLLVPSLGLGLVAWAAEGIGLYLILQRLGIDAGLLPAIGIYATAMLAGALSFLPGGLGSTELVMVTLLATTGAAGPATVAATACIRLATLWFAMALGACAWLAIEGLYGATAFRLGRGRSQ